MERCKPNKHPQNDRFKTILLLVACDFFFAMLLAARGSITAVRQAMQLMRRRNKHRTTAGTQNDHKEAAREYRNRQINETNAADETWTRDESERYDYLWTYNVEKSTRDASGEALNQTSRLVREFL